MKKVNKNFVARPSSLVLGSYYYNNAINELGIQKCWPTNYSSIYKSDSVRNQLNLIYRGKCAFCNQIPKGSPLQVEHFRPKNGVKNVLHSGYYWLGYEWTNLLFACGNCNSTKNTNFPLIVETDRVNAPSWISLNKFNLNECLINSSILKKEKYFLINPEIDNPDNHFLYEQDGRITHRDERGRISINNYNLNRDELYIDGRKKLLDKILKKIAKKFEKYNDHEFNIKILYSQIVDIIMDDIVDPVNANASFDHFRLTLFKDFDLYIVPRFGIKEHRYILNVIFNKLTTGLNVKLH